MTTKNQISSFFAGSECRYQILYSRLLKISGEDATSVLAILHFHQRELDCILHDYLIPEVFITERKYKPLSVPPIPGLIAFSSNNYRLFLDLHVLSKAFFFQLRVCVDDALKLLNMLYIYVRHETHGPTPSTDFSKFIDYLLSDRHRHLDSRIVSILDSLLIELVILRFIRNYLKGDGILLFNYIYMNGGVEVDAQFEFQQIDDKIIDKMVKSDRLRFEGKSIHFYLIDFCETIIERITSLTNITIDKFIESTDSQFADDERSYGTTNKDICDVVFQHGRNLSNFTPPVEIDLSQGTLGRKLEIFDPKSDDMATLDIFSVIEKNGKLSITLENGSKLKVKHILDEKVTSIVVDFTKYYNKILNIEFSWHAEKNLFHLKIDEDIYSPNDSVDVDI